MPRIFLFVSTGRCGTQWLASNLAAVYGDVAEVTHEPLAAAYRPRDYLRAYDRAEDMLQIDAVREHLDHVERTADDRIYIETGWPSYAAIPFFIRRFGDQVGLVRVLRHPVPTAISFVTHGFWSGRGDGYATDAILDPWVEGVVQTDYTRRWKDMSPYEKCLFWWTELHLYADELQTRYPDVPWHDVYFETMFERETTLSALASFLGLPERPTLHAASGERSDDWQQRTGIRFDWWEIFDHPNTLAEAERHGYKVRWHDAKALRARYGSASPRWMRSLLRPARWARARVRATT